jgi:hypothetical protein
MTQDTDHLERAVAVRIPRPFVLEVEFDDGTQRLIDMEGDLWGEVFEPLRDPDYFALAAVDPVCGSVFWPNGADLSPEFLYYGEDGPPPGYYEPREVDDDAVAPTAAETT